MKRPRRLVLLHLWYVLLMEKRTRMWMRTGIKMWMRMRKRVRKKTVTDVLAQRTRMNEMIAMMMRTRKGITTKVRKLRETMMTMARLMMKQIRKHMKMHMLSHELRNKKKGTSTEQRTLPVGSSPNMHRSMPRELMMEQTRRVGQLTKQTIAKHSEAADHRTKNGKGMQKRTEKRGMWVETRGRMKRKVLHAEKESMHHASILRERANHQRCSVCVLMRRANKTKRMRVARMTLRNTIWTQDCSHSNAMILSQTHMQRTSGLSNWTFVHAKMEPIKVDRSA